MRRYLNPLRILPLALILSACGSGAFSNPFIQQIQATLTPSAVTLPAGGTTLVAVIGTVAGSTTPLTGLSVSVGKLPTGLNATASTGEVQVSASKTLVAGTYSVPLHVSMTGGEGDAVLAVTVTAPAAPYTVTVTPSPVSLSTGQSLRVAVQATDSSNNPVTSLRIVNITGSLPVKQAASDLTGFTLSAPVDATLGSYILNVTTTDGTNTLTTPLPVTLTAPTTTAVTQ